MKVLVFGAGVLGSIFAANLYDGGLDTTILARGKRFEIVNTEGIQIYNEITKQTKKIHVPVIDTISDENNFDLILVIVRRNQVESTLSELGKARNSPNIIFLGNNVSGIDAYLSILDQKQLLLGFAMAGGGWEGNIIKATIQDRGTLLIGEIDGKISDRVLKIQSEIEKTGVKMDLSTNIDAWLKYHLALVQPLAMGIYVAEGDNYALAKSKPDMKIMILAIREGFKTLKRLGYPTLPKSMRKMQLLPNFVLIRYLAKLVGSYEGELALQRHAMAAKDEFSQLAKDFRQLIAKSGIETPNWDDLEIRSKFHSLGSSSNNEESIC